MQADTLIVAAGSPGLVTKHMVKKGALVVNCGTTYDAHSRKLLPDVCDDVAEVAQFVTPTPHGVGPTCAAALTLNVLTLAEAALRRRVLETRHKAAPASREEPPDTASVPLWSGDTCPSTRSSLLRRAISCSTFREAVALINDITVLAERANHHPTLSINPSRKCEVEGGCDVVVELSTYSTKKVTRADVELARRIDALA
jgi:pterin-4a-carbinolamine dehydratase